MNGGQALVDGLCLSRETAQELWQELFHLEEIKFDHCEKLKRQRYEVETKAHQHLRFKNILLQNDSNLFLNFIGDFSQKPHR